jgi:CHAD domain-containing protein
VKDLVKSSVEKIKHDLKHFKNQSHLIRKHLKDIFYWSKIFDEEALLTKSKLKTLDKILDHLGSIQDHEVLIANIKYFRKTILSAGITEYHAIKKIENDARKKKDTLLEKANNLTKEWIHQIDI